MARIIHFVCRPKYLVTLLLMGALVFAACDIAPQDFGAPPKPLTTSGNTIPAAKKYDMFPKGKTEPAPKFPKPSHLSPCESDSDCFNGTKCTNLFGEGGVCLFTCNPKEGKGEDQNPNCIEPENCIELGSSKTNGVCIALPGQLYGIGGYKAYVGHKQGKRCLLRYGGCGYGLICVDTSKNGSVGTCEESCIGTSSRCKTSGTSCKILASGYHACLKK